MAVATTNARDVFSCNGVTQSFALTFSFLDEDSLVVTKVTISSGSTSTLVLGTDYTISGGEGATGTMSTTSAFSSSFQLIVDRVEPFLQPTVFSKYGAFPAKVVEKAYDRIVYQVQRLVALSNRVLRQPTGDTVDINTLPVKATRAGKVLYFDTDGHPAASDSSMSTIESGVSGAVQASTSAAASAASASAAAASAASSSAGAAASASAAAASAASISLPLPVASGGTAATSTSAALTSLGAVGHSITSSFTVGYVSVSDTVSTVSSGSYTPVPTSGRNFQAYINGGAHNLVAPTTAGNYSIAIQITNNASAGTITPTSFSKVTPSATPFTTTNGDDFMCYITKVNGFTHLHVQKLQ